MRYRKAIFPIFLLMLVLAPSAEAATISHEPADPKVGDVIKFSPTVGSGTAPMRWDFGDGTTDTTRGSAKHSYSEPGDYRVTVRVEGNVISKTITVHPRKPKADFSYNIHPDGRVTFNAGSTNTYGSDVTYTWKFGKPSKTYSEGNYERTNSEETTTQYSNTGVYEVTLSVENSKGMTDSISKVLEINEITSSRSDEQNTSISTQDNSNSNGDNNSTIPDETGMIPNSENTDEQNNTSSIHSGNPTEDTNNTLKILTATVVLGTAIIGGILYRRRGSEDSPIKERYNKAK